MTPETFSFSGRCELSPPNIRLPTWRLGYWTRMRRCERSMKQMKAITATDMISSSRMNRVDSAPVRPRDRKSVVEGKSVSVSVDLGGRRIIKKKRTNEKLDKEKKK